MDMHKVRKTMMMKSTKMKKQGAAPGKTRSRPFGGLALLALGALGALLAGCTASGKLIDMEGGEEIRLEVKPTWGGAMVTAVTESGERLKGEVREVVTTVENSPRRRKFHGKGAVDTVWYGTGYLKGGSRVIDIEYWRPDNQHTIVGTATDNRGRRYKLLL